MPETALITGASSGIGLELAKLFAADGCNLVLVARREARLQELASELRAQHGIEVHTLTSDLASADAPRQIFETLSQQGVTVDILVNNAGFGERGPVVELDTQRQVDMGQVNVAALTHLTRLFLPSMIERRSGGILNVASSAAFQPGPYMAVYYATKAYVLSFSEALHEELRKTAVRVSCLCPGATTTEFAAEAHMEDSRLFRMGVMNASDVARAGYHGLRRGKAVVVPGLKNKLGSFSIRFSPRASVRRVVASLNKDAK